MKTLILVATLLTMGSWVVEDLEKVNKLWEKANALYQLELYEEATRDFKICLEAYEEANEKEMATVTQACLAFCYLRMGDSTAANDYLGQIKYKIKDSEWNKTIAGIYGELGDVELQAKYLKKAEKYKE